ncbi:diguanylate cyclase [Deinococcus taeanensis]|uniref:sensor domain-containing diguanylate cyclase n=1 Tax=Deinococcus taeanensis TaxID=2737050 RepID=UPI001CDD03DD|nr:diguanylate cyclase [Deinococcus taeanensis]UBV41447.1 diguanylate cyclase [Deinococcus taeanensis]
MPTLSLTALLSTAFAAIFLLFGLLETYLNTRAATQQLQAKVGQSLGQFAYEMTDKLDRGMFERARDLEILSALGDVQNVRAGGDQTRTLLDRLKSTFPSYAWIGLADPQGKVLVSTGGLLEGQSVATRPWFQGALKGPFAGDVHEAKLLAGLLPREGSEPLRFVDVATPVHNAQGRVTGVLGAHLSWTWAQEVRESLLQPVQDREQFEVFIVDRQGVVLLGPPDLQGQALPAALLERFPVSGYAVERWPDGRMYVTGSSRSRGYRTYTGLEWRVIVRQDTQVAFAGVGAFRRTSILLNVSLSVLFAALGLVLAHFIARPLRRLRAAAHAIEAGVLNAELPPVTAYAEARTLSLALQRLLEHLKRNERDLERRILDRTDALHRRTQEAETLSALSVLSTQHQDAAQLTAALAPLTAQACALDLVAWATVDGDTVTLRVLTEQNGAPAFPEAARSESAERSLHSVASALGQPLYVEAYAQQVQALPAAVAWGVRSAAYIPVCGPNGERTVLFAARCTDRPWTDADRRVLEAAARSVQISQERRASLLELEFAALHDRLTGLGNRRAFDQNLDQAVSASKRHQGTFGVMVIDLDGLKGVNDHEGHERGDALLREFAGALRTAFRNEDRIFRLGGDEYAVLLDRATVSGARTVLERVRAAVRLTRQAGFSQMDASAGIAFFPEDAWEAPALTRLADERMYEEKHDHRALRQHTTLTTPGEPTPTPALDS